MPTKSINMHGKKYNLTDETARTKAQAQAKAKALRKQGKVAFLNPQKRKGKTTKYHVYEAPKAVRKTKPKTKGRPKSTSKKPSGTRGKMTNIPTRTINMHGKLYNLADETARTKTAAQAKAKAIRKQGGVAFLNPRKRKGIADKYFVYEAKKGKRTITTRKTTPTKRGPGRPRKTTTTQKKLE